MAFLLAHLSDPHLGSLPPVTLADLAGKRLFGYWNWVRNRRRVHDDAVTDALLADLHAAHPDHIAVTGDLVNLALPAEFAHARTWLDALGPADDVSVVPGNHDAYVRGAFAEFNRLWRPFMTGDAPAGADFPFVRRRGPVALVGVTTAVPAPPGFATGRVGKPQAAALAAALAAAGRAGLFRIVLIHHSPVAGATPWLRRLTDAGEVRRAIAGAGAELVLHGHNHRFSLAHIAGPAAPVPVVGATAASLRPHDGRPGGSYNLLRIDGGQGAWTVDLSQHRCADGGVVAGEPQRIVG